MGTRANAGAGRRRYGRKISCRAAALNESINELIQESIVVERVARDTCHAFIAGLKNTDPTILRIMKRIMEME